MEKMENLSPIWRCIWYYNEFNAGNEITFGSVLSPCLVPFIPCKKTKRLCPPQTLILPCPLFNADVFVVAWKSLRKQDIRQQ